MTQQHDTMTAKRKAKGLYTAKEVMAKVDVSPSTWLYHRMAGLIPMPLVHLGGRRKYYTKTQVEVIAEYFAARVRFSRLK